MKIALLPEHLVNKIAAGEVVDRPASIVKELVENSIDAGASRINVVLEGGGRTGIEVNDDGSGMEKSDALMAFERHATSKLKSEEDLFSLTSRGFRGEALASIASVSKISLLTQYSETETGWSIQIEAGKILGVTPTSRAVGTTVRIRSLFYNTPVRRKFLRSETYEASRVRQMLRRIAILEPSVSFQLIEGGKTTIFFPTPATWKERAQQQLHGATVVCEGSKEGVLVQGLVGHPSTARSDLEGMIVYVNRRNVSDRIIQRAVREGFQSTLKNSEHPVGVVSVTLDSHSLDVNVHPQKSEVRFVNPQAIFELVRDTVSEAVNSFRIPLDQSEIKTTDKTKNSSTYLSNNYATPWRSELKEKAITVRVAEIAVEDPVIKLKSDQVPYWKEPDVIQPAEIILAEQNTFAENAFNESLLTFRYSSMHYLGQVAECYLLFEDRSEMVVMDMHAAHERVNYVKIWKSVASAGLVTQPLLIPFSVHIAPDAIPLIELHRDELATFGFELKIDLSCGRVDIISEPVLPLQRSHLSRHDLNLIFQELASTEEWQGAAGTFKERLSAVIARIACHSSIRSGDRLDASEVKALCEDLDGAELSSACPHGRPVVVRFKKNAMERWFGRDK
jgi:DNA mismatch repair protein MutL